MQLDDHRRKRWSSSCFSYFFHRTALFLQCSIHTDLVKYDSNTVSSTPTFFNAVTNHLETVDAVLCLWDLTNLIKRFWSLRRSLVFSIYCSRWLTTQISWPGYLKSTIGSRWRPGHGCFHDSCVSVIKYPLNPIQDGGGKNAPPYQFFPCNFYKRKNWPLKLSDF